MEGLDRSEVLLEFFKALADGKRLQIVGLLAQQDYAVEELAAILGLSPASVSHHLQRLARVGLVAARADQHHRAYSLRLEALQEMSQQVLSGERPQEAAGDPDLDAYEREVLRDHMEAGRLTRWPHQWKQRKVILRYLLEQFEPGRRYSEREVNEIIGRVHPDFATLRREMIDAGLMARERDVYWRKE
jgi:DNA-binding HxlR family transcriptional regulator